MFEGEKGFDNHGGFATGGTISGLGLTYAPADSTTDVEMHFSRSPAISYADGTPIFPESLNSFELTYEGLSPSWATEERVPYVKYHFSKGHLPE